jgi:hypothetical protein
MALRKVTNDDGKPQHIDEHIFRLMRRSSDKWRFSKRSPAINVSTSELEVWPQGDSNSLKGRLEQESAPQGEAQQKEICSRHSPTSKNGTVRSRFYDIASSRSVLYF